MDVIRVLLAEDVPVIRMGLRALLAPCRDLFLEPREASDGREAVRLAGELRPHVVLMDLSMPVLDGVAAIGQIRARWPAVRVLALTGHEDPALAKAALDAGAGGFLLKSATGEELARALRRVAGRG